MKGVYIFHRKWLQKVLSLGSSHFGALADFH